MKHPIRIQLLWLLLSGVLLGCDGGAGSSQTETDRSSPALTGLSPVSVEVSWTNDPVQEKRIHAFCGDCHSPPPASSFPKEAWPAEVRRGFEFYHESFREDLDPPPEATVVAYYQALAPAELELPEPPASTPSPIPFEQLTSSSPEIAPPAVAYASWLEVDSEPGRLFYCDMRSGEVRSLHVDDERQFRDELLTLCAHVAHIEKCDLDGDGQDDLVLAELGSPLSGDHQRGAVIWLRRDGKGWKQQLLMSGLGRVADVQPADFDQDGDLDLLVAEFGHFHTGRILLLENDSLETHTPTFKTHVLDDRHGTIHVPVVDLDGDGRLDFVALVSQDFEVVDAFLNNGDNTFRRETLYTAEDPAHGSSGIQIVDLDGDADMDVVYSNGDTFGSEHLKPYHGVHWLENRGEFPFTDHFLTPMFGVQKAVAADLDGDQDQDIVAVALMPKNLIDYPALHQQDSVLWLEQTQPGVFARHGLEQGQFNHAAVEFADFDQDGHLDLVVGNMYPEEGPKGPSLTIWFSRPTIRETVSSD